MLSDQRLVTVSHTQDRSSTDAVIYEPNTLAAIARIQGNAALSQPARSAAVVPQRHRADRSRRRLQEQCRFRAVAAEDHESRGVAQFDKRPGHPGAERHRFRTLRVEPQQRVRPAVGDEGTPGR
jgi:hypothetical protein